METTTNNDKDNDNDNNKATNQHTLVKINTKSNTTSKGNNNSLYGKHRTDTAKYCKFDGKESWIQKCHKTVEMTASTAKNVQIP